jgi:cellulose biosynthesis protein BcsQ
MDTAGAQRGRTVTFYSYKGGTGRSMALANVAWVLACSGRRVLVIDWDLEAPGLHRYFAPFLADPDLKETSGLIDFVWDFTTEALTPGNEEDGNWFVPLADFKRSAISLEYDFPPGGGIDFVPAGCQGGDYADRVGSFDWKRFYEDMGGGVFLETAAGRAREDYDYVFLDSRTGVSDISGICTIHLPDLLIVCFTANNQSIKGTAAIAESVREQWAADPDRKGAPPRIYPLLTRVDGFERDRLDRRKALVRAEFAKLLRGSEGLMELPYIPIYSYEETLAVFRDRPEDKEAALLPGIERLASLITDGKISRLESPPKDVQRRRTLARFEGHGGTELETATKAVEASRYDVFISHSASDKAAVEEISRRLAERGIRAFFDTLQLNHREGSSSQVVAALDASLSAAIFIGPSGLDPWQTQELHLALDRRPVEGVFRIIPVFLPGADPETVTLPATLRALTFIDFRRSLNEGLAFERLVAGIRGVSLSSSGAEISVENPYPGLTSFDNASARFFFGREQLTERLLSSIRLALQNDDRLLFLVGASGSGKSSILNAGLIPKLAQGIISGSDQWLVVICRPGSDPLQNLARSVMAAGSMGLESAVNDAQSSKAAVNSLDHPTALDPLVREVLGQSHIRKRLLLVVDQFEELFRFPDLHTREAFIGNLRHATLTKGGPTVVVISLRSDFYDECLTYPALTTSLERYCTVVGPLTDAELRTAIERPAQILGCEFEPGLVELLLNDARGQSAALPLIQLALAELWTRRDGRRLTVESYEQIGGVAGFLSRRASEVLSSFDENERSICRQIFLRLVNPGDGTHDTKVRVPVAELMPVNGPSEAISAVIRKLAEARLISLGRDGDGIETVEIAHESLIRNWDLLRSWIEDSRSALRARTRLTLAAREWQRNERDSSYLYSGAQITKVRKEIESYRYDLTSIEQNFLAASESVERQSSKRLRRITLTAILLFILLSIAVWQGIRAELLRREVNRQKLEAIKQWQGRAHSSTTPATTATTKNSPTPKSPSSRPEN